MNMAWMNFLKILWFQTVIYTNDNMEIYQARKISNIPTAISQPFDFVCSHNEKFKIKDIGVCRLYSGAD